MDDRLVDAVLPLLAAQRKRGKEATLDECMEQARDHGVRADLVILLVRHELSPVTFDRRGKYGNLLISVATAKCGDIYHDDHQALEALNLVARALGQNVTVQVIE